jgi:hypothetical protein
LRNVTGFAVSVQQADATDLASANVPPSAEGASGNVPTTPTAPKPQSARAGCIFSLICVLAPLVLGGLGWGAQRYQEHITSDLVAQVHAQPFLFADPLYMDSGNWPIEQASDNAYPERYDFQGGAYHMQGVMRDRIMYAWGSPSYADVAVEATVSEHGSDPNDGVGLLLRGSESSTDFVEFMVDESGHWWLWGIATWARAPMTIGDPSPMAPVRRSIAERAPRIDCSSSCRAIGFSATSTITLSVRTATKARRSPATWACIQTSATWKGYTATSPSIQRRRSHFRLADSAKANPKAARGNFRRWAPDSGRVPPLSRIRVKLGHT